MFLILRIQYILKYSHKIEFLCKSSWIVLYRQPHIKHLGGINSSGCRISVYFYPLHNMNRYMMNLLPLICMHIKSNGNKWNYYKLNLKLS